MDNNFLIELGRMMGVEEDRLEKLSEKYLKVEEDELDFTTGTVAEKHTKILNTCRKTLRSFENCDVVECNVDIINPTMVRNIWENINVYSYDVENFFIERCVLNLSNKNGDNLKIYFSIEEGNIFMYAVDKNDEEMLGGTITIREGHFLPYGALNEDYYEFFRRDMLKKGELKDRQSLGDEMIMSNLLYFLIINQMVINDREIITETSKRVEVKSKKKPSKKKNQSKKTTVIRYIKVDEVKIKKIREDYEKQSRGSYERHISEWTKRGHWRKLANGDKIWIKPTVAKAQNKVGEKLQKIYKIQ